jgi:uncharacterized protein
MYDTGKGVSHDSAMAAYWYRKAAEQGNAPAEQNLAVNYYKGQGVTRDMAAGKLNPNQIADAQKQVAAWNSRMPRTD